MVTMTTTTALLTDRYELHHAPGRAGRRDRPPPGGLRGVRPPAAPTAAATASWPGSAGWSTRSRPSASTTRTSPGSSSGAIADGRPPTTCADYRFTGDSRRLPRRRDLLPEQPGPHRPRHLRRVRRARDARPVDPQPRHRDRRRPPPAWSSPRTAARCIEMGSRRTARARRRRRRPRGVHRGLRRDLQPRGRAHATASPPSARPPTRSRSPTPTSGPRSRPGRGRSAPARRSSSTPSTSPQGIRNAVEVAGRGPRGESGIDSGDLAEERPRGPRPARRARRDDDPDRRHERPRRVRHRRARGRAHRRLRRRHPARHGSGHPTAGLVYKLVAIADSTGRDAPMRPVAKKPHRQAAASAAARSPTGSSTTTGTPTRRPWSSAPARRRPTAGLGGRCRSPSSATAQVVHRPSLAEIRAHHSRRRPSCPPAGPRPRGRHPAPGRDRTAIGSLIGARMRAP